jgi:hypothetical protein
MCPDKSDRTDKQIPDQSSKVNGVTATLLPEAESQLESAPYNETHGQTLETDLHSLLRAIMDYFDSEVGWILDF